jgi:hypothetical protein
VSITGEGFTFELSLVLAFYFGNDSHSLSCAPSMELRLLIAWQS